MTQECKRFDVFNIREFISNKEVKQSWTRVGTAFENRDGSLNVRLHLLPLPNPKSGYAELHIREPRPIEDNTPKHGSEPTTQTRAEFFQYDSSGLGEEDF